MSRDAGIRLVIYLGLGLAKPIVGVLGEVYISGCSCAPQETTKRRLASNGDALMDSRCEVAPGDNTIEPANSSGYCTATSSPTWAPWEKPNVMTFPFSMVTRSLT